MSAESQSRAQFGNLLTTNIVSVVSLDSIAPSSSSSVRCGFTILDAASSLVQRNGCYGRETERSANPWMLRRADGRVWKSDRGCQLVREGVDRPGNGGTQTAQG